MHGDEEPDREFGRGVRFGCGFVFGLVIFGVTVMKVAGADWVYAVGGALVIGLLSMWFGDKFWEWIARFTYWWP